MASEIKVGDVVGFKDDIEQYSKVLAVRRTNWGTQQVQVQVNAGEYRGQIIWVDADDCWTD